MTRGRSFANVTRQNNRENYNNSDFSTTGMHNNNVNNYMQGIDLKLDQIKQEITATLNNQLKNLFIKIQENRNLIDTLYSLNTE